MKQIYSISFCFNVSPSFVNPLTFQPDVTRSSARFEDLCTNISEVHVATYYFFKEVKGWAQLWRHSLHRLAVSWPNRQSSVKYRFQRKTLFKCRYIDFGKLKRIKISYFTTCYLISKDIANRGSVIWMRMDLRPQMLKHILSLFFLSVRRNLISYNTFVRIYITLTDTNIKCQLIIKPFLISKKIIPRGSIIEHIAFRVNQMRTDDIPLIFIYHYLVYQTLTFRYKFCDRFSCNQSHPPSICGFHWENDLN